MNIQEYQRNAKRTCPSLEGGIDRDFLHMELGVITECGEVLDVFKKNIAYGKEIDWINVGEELADIAWYVVNKATFSDIVLNEQQLEKAYDEFFSKAVKEHKNSMESRTEMTVGVLSQILVNIVGAAPGNIFNSPIVIIASLKAVADVHGIDFKDMLERNIAKLKVRFPDKFDAEKAINRDLDAERKTLEA